MAKKYRWIYKRKDSPFFWYCFEVNGKTYSGSTDRSHNDPQGAFNKATQMRSQALNVRDNFEKIDYTFQEIIDDHLNSSILKKKASYSDISFRLGRVKEFFGPSKLARLVTDDDLVDFRDELIADGMAQTTTNHYLNDIRAAFHRAIRKGNKDKIRKAEENPASQVDFFPATTLSRCLNEDEKIRLLSACVDQDLYDLVSVALFTGMRESEIFELSWSKNISFPLNDIYLPWHKTKEDKDKHMPMFDEVRKILERRRTANPASDWVFPSENGEQGTWSGAIAAGGSYRWKYWQALKTANILDTTKFHLLRHTFASDMLMAGVDIKTVAQFLGHTTTKMLETRYAHILRKHLNASIQLVPKGFLSKVNRVGKPYVSPTLETEQKVAFSNYIQTSSQN